MTFRSASILRLREKRIKISAKVVSRGRYIAFQIAEAATPRNVFADGSRLIAELRPAASRIVREAFLCHALARTHRKKCALMTKKLHYIRQTALRWLVPNPPTSRVSGFGLAGVAGKVQISDHPGSRHPANVGYGQSSSRSVNHCWGVYGVALPC
jgi:hypothetical protein